MPRRKIFILCFAIFYFVSVALISGCVSITKAKVEPTRVEGPIDTNFAARFEDAGSASKVIIVNSPGGLPSAALKTAKWIRKQEIDIIINNACFSACAEYLLAAAASSDHQTLVFKNRPLIGFHWNAPMLESIMKKNLSDDFSHCDFSDTENLAQLHNDTGVNHLFWMKVIENLGANLSDYRLNGEGCPQIRARFKNVLWLPNSEGLQRDFGLRFEGGVCSDDLRSCNQRIDQNWRSGTRLMVADELHISRGAVSGESIDN